MISIRRPAWLAVAAVFVFSSLVRADSDLDAGKRILAGVKCMPASHDPLRTFCPATLQQTQAIALPPAVETYFGITLELAPSDNDIRTAIMTKTSASALHLGPTGVLVTWLKASNAREQRMMTEALFNVGGALKGEQPTVEIAGALDDFLKAEAKKPLHPVTLAKDHKSGAFSEQMPSHIYRTADAWVVIETGPKTVFLNVYPIAPIKVK